MKSRRQGWLELWEEFVGFVWGLTTLFPNDFLQLATDILPSQILSISYENKTLDSFES